MRYCDRCGHRRASTGVTPVAVQYGLAQRGEKVCLPCDAHLEAQAQVLLRDERRAG